MNNRMKMGSFCDQKQLYYALPRILFADPLLPKFESDEMMSCSLNGADVRYSMRVTGVHNDCLSRQVTEGVNISNFRGDVLMNRRGELGGVRVERQQYRRWGDNQ